MTQRARALHLPRHSDGRRQSLIRQQPTAVPGRGAGLFRKDDIAQPATSLKLAHAEQKPLSLEAQAKTTARTPRTPTPPPEAPAAGT
ncbi:unnamed protein product [Boreogadus saida]